MSSYFQDRSHNPDSLPYLHQFMDKIVVSTGGRIWAKPSLSSSYGSSSCISSSVSGVWRLGNLSLSCAMSLDWKTYGMSHLAPWNYFHIHIFIFYVVKLPVENPFSSDIDVLVLFQGGTSLCQASTLQNGVNIPSLAIWIWRTKSTSCWICPSVICSRYCGLGLWSPVVAEATNDFT